MGPGPLKVGQNLDIICLCGWWLRRAPRRRRRRRPRPAAAPARAARRLTRPRARSLHAASLTNSWCHEWRPRTDAAGGVACAALDVRWVAWLNAGEGWHRSHHDDPRCAYHGHRARGFDLVYAAICALERLGLVSGVRHEHVPGRRAAEAEPHTTREALAGADRSEESRGKKDL